MIYRYFIQLSFNGTNYHGWQIQPNAVTVQSIVNKAVSTILNTEIELTGAGRTDTGVHASFFIAHFDSMEANLENNTKFIFKLNCMLPPDIAIQKIIQVRKDAHARFDAISRTYQYFISTSKNPFKQDFAYYHNQQLDINLMNQAAQLLLNYSDFTSFSRLHSDNKTNICNIMKASWVEEGELLVFTITADRFLRNMVRAIVGTLIEVGLKKITINEFQSIITTHNRNKAGASAPAKGLFLTEILYPETVQMKKI